MNELFKVLQSLLETDTSWAVWTRKIITSGLLATLIYFGYDTYETHQKTQTNYQDIQERIDADPDAFESVKRIMSEAHIAYDTIKGIWLYSWPTAHTIEVVHNTGTEHDPLPLGHFWASDAADVGKLALRICTELNRNASNTACTVWGNEDAWGVLVVVWDSDQKKPDHYTDIVTALAHKIGNLLYPHHND